MTNLLTCPNCDHKFEATQALTNQIKLHLEVENAIKFKEQKDKLEKESQELTLQSKLLEEQRLKSEEIISQKAQVQITKDRQEMNKKWLEEQTKLKLQAQQEAKSKIELEMQDLKNQNMEKDKKLAEASKQELEIRQKARELEEAKKNFELEMTRKMDVERQTIEMKTKESLEEQYRLKLAEKDKQLEQTNKALEDARRKSDQGSMQIQGDVQENDLKNILTQNFIYDIIVDVPTGVQGADLIQKVNTNFGKHCGTIIWESKRTKTWSDDWVKKLKDDQAKTQGDVAILVTQALPEEIKTFGLYKGVWVVQYNPVYILSSTSAIRHFLVEIHQVKSSQIGRDEKMEYLYNYLTGSQFRNKIENIVTAFISMQDELQKEKRALQAIWNRREKEISRVIDSTTALYGDLQGIMGGALQTISQFELTDSSE